MGASLHGGFQIVSPSNTGILVQQQWLGFNGLNQT